jgi:hypothetical protein
MSNLAASVGMNPLAGAVSSAISPSPLFTAFPVVNTITLSGTTMPGKWTLISAAKKFGWEIRKGYGLSGAFVFPTGDNLVCPEFRVEFWANSDMLRYKTARKVLLTKASISLGLTAMALGIGHPELTALGVSSVVVGTAYPVIQEGAGLWTTKVEFIQYRPPVIAPPKPQGSTPDAATAPPIALNATQAENIKLANELTARLGAK